MSRLRNFLAQSCQFSYLSLPFQSHWWHQFDAQLMVQTKAYLELHFRSRRIGRWTETSQSCFSILILPRNPFKGSIVRPGLVCPIAWPCKNSKMFLIWNLEKIRMESVLAEFEKDRTFISVAVQAFSGIVENAFWLRNAPLLHLSMEIQWKFQLTFFGSIRSSDSKLRSAWMLKTSRVWCKFMILKKLLNFIEKSFASSERFPWYS